MARYSPFYAEFLRQPHPRLESIEQRIALAELDGEIDNIRAAWRARLTAVQILDAEVLAAFGKSMRLYLDRRSLVHEAVAIFGQTCDRLAAVLADGTGYADVHRLVYGQMLTHQAFFVKNLGQFEVASDLLALGLGELRSMRAPSAQTHWEIAWSLHMLGGIRWQQGQYVTAREHLLESLALYQAVGDRKEAAKTISVLGALASHLGEYVQAERLLAEAMVILREFNEPRSVAYALSGMGTLLADQERLAEARHVLQECLAISRTWGDPQSVAQALYRLGSTLSQMDTTAQSTAQPLLHES